MTIRRTTRVPGWRDLQCQWCGPTAGWFVVLSRHLTVAHGKDARARYRSEFPGAQLASDAFVGGLSALATDRAEDGTWFDRKKRLVCHRGHRLTKANTRGRGCRKCSNMAARQRNLERYATDPDYRARKLAHQSRLRLDPAHRARQNEYARQWRAARKAEREAKQVKA